MLLIVLLGHVSRAAGVWLRVNVHRCDASSTELTAGRLTAMLPPLLITRRFSLCVPPGLLWQLDSLCRSAFSNVSSASLFACAGLTPMSARLLPNSNAKTPGEAPPCSYASKPAAAAAPVGSCWPLCAEERQPAAYTCQAVHGYLYPCSALLLPHHSAAGKSIMQSWHQAVMGQSGLVLSDAGCLQAGCLQRHLQMCLCMWDYVSHHCGLQNAPEQPVQL